MHIDALAGGANSKASGSSYLRDIRGKNIIEEIIPLTVKSIGEAKNYLPRNVSNQTSHNQVSFLPSASTVFHDGFTKDFPYDKDAKKVSMCGANDNSHKDYCDVPTGRELILYGEGGSQRELLSAANRNNYIDQNRTLTPPESIQEGIKSFQHPTVTVPVPRPTPRKKAAARNSICDRLRRVRKTEKLRAMQELLPHSQKGTILSVMEEIIDYVKSLQLQIKVLTQNRLGGEPTFDPFINLEGFGHYLLHDQMLNEPLEMTIGRMMEGNMSAVTQLLETKGLYVMPMPLEGSSKPGP